VVPNNDDKIIAQVYHERALEQGDIIEVESEDEEDEEVSPAITTPDALEMCKMIKGFCLKTGVDSALDVSQVLHHFQAKIWQEYSQNMKQPTLVDVWGHSK
jgi:hypothetical protein